MVGVEGIVPLDRKALEGRLGHQNLPAASALKPSTATGQSPPPLDRFQTQLPLALLAQKLSRNGPSSSAAGCAHCQSCSEWNSPYFQGPFSG